MTGLSSSVITCATSSTHRSTIDRSVYMAKARTSDEFVAIKTIRNDVYARREIEILLDLSREPHPNIVRLVDDFQSSTSDCEAPKSRHIALSLARGPTLHYILNKGGALGLVIARAISRQLVSAIAHLHDRQIIHRDIQVRVVYGPDPSIRTCLTHTSLQTSSFRGR